MSNDSVRCSALVACRGEVHRVVLTRRGALALCDHSKEDIKVEDVAVKLGGKKCGCADHREAMISGLDLLRTHRKKARDHFVRFPIEEECWKYIYDACQCVFGPGYVYPYTVRVRPTWKYTAGKIGDKGIVTSPVGKALVLDAEDWDGGWLIVLARWSVSNALLPGWMRAGEYKVPKGMKLACYLWNREDTARGARRDGYILRSVRSSTIPALLPLGAKGMSASRMRVVADTINAHIRDIAQEPRFRKFTYQGIELVEIPGKPCPECGRKLDTVHFARFYLVQDDVYEGSREMVCPEYHTAINDHGSCYLEANNCGWRGTASEVYECAIKRGEDEEKSA